MYPSGWKVRTRNAVVRQNRSESSNLSISAKQTKTTVNTVVFFVYTIFTRLCSISSPHVLPLVGRGASRCSMSLICWNVQDVLLSPECLCPHWRAGSVAVTEVMNTDTFDTCQVCKLLVGLFKRCITDGTLAAADVHIITELWHCFLTAFVMF